MQSLVAGFALLAKGGFMMYPLLFSALVALTVIFERLYVLAARFSTPAAVIDQALANIASGNLADADRVCQGHQTPVATVVLAGLRNFDSTIEHMELAMKNQAEKWVPVLERRIEVIDTVITAAPLMGLLGTITGMMGSFRVLSEKGVNEPNAITGGVAEALIATATGLVIALVCLMAYNYLNARIKNLVYELETTASGVVEARMASRRGSER
jgi:biopolymer transport protein ExbB